MFTDCSDTASVCDMRSTVVESERLVIREPVLVLCVVYSSSGFFFYVFFCIDCLE